jgi:hypothetical protein
MIGERKEVMWVFDGEEWTQDDGSEHSSAKPETARKQWVDELVPELQVIEIVHVPEKRPIPPFPMP